MRVHYITYHAVEQYIRRWEPEKTVEKARSELSNLLTGCKNIGKTHAGHSIVVSGERPEVRMVVKDRNVCVTVLPRYQEDEKIEEIAIANQEINTEYQTRLDYLKKEITERTQEIDKLTEERRILGERKHELENERQRLEHDLYILECWEQ